jgi:hypothetical protein
MTRDRIVNEVINEIQGRSEKWICKYWTTLEENNKDDYLQHLKEELMDWILYIHKLQDNKKKNENI